MSISLRYLIIWLRHVRFHECISNSKLPLITEIVRVIFVYPSGLPGLGREQGCGVAFVSTLTGTTLLAMSFGRPGSSSILQVNPPDRGSFPLDHDGECKEMMKVYLKCLKEHGSASTPCRGVSKAYLDCRMQRGLMQRESWTNLGLGEETNEKTSGQPS